MISLNKEQQLAYDRWIRARNRMGYNKAPKQKWVPKSDVIATVDVIGLNHPQFEHNDLWQEYKAAFDAWLAVEPEFRKTERMSMIRGDYDTTDTWKDEQHNIVDSYSKFKEE